MVLKLHFDRYMDHIQGLLDGGAPIGGVGFQAHLGPDSIDLGKIEDTLNRNYDRFGISMWITEFDWQSESAASAQHAEALDNFYRLVLR